MKKLTTLIQNQQIFLTRQNKYLNVLEGLTEIQNNRVIFFGESHAKSSIIQLQTAILEQLVERAGKTGSRVNVIMEHFAFNQQPLLDKFVQNQLTIEQLHEEYKATGIENHEIPKYLPLLDLAREHSKVVSLLAGFIPRQHAKDLVNNGEEATLKQVAELGYIDINDYQRGSEDHYNEFESLISGRNLALNRTPTDRFRKIFGAQVLKDQAMATRVIEQIKKRGSEDDTYLVIMGKGHCEYGFGVPERVLSSLQKLGLKLPTTIVTTREEEAYSKEVDPTEKFEFLEKFGQEFPGDFVYFYKEDKEQVDNEIKCEVQTVYNKVAQKVEDKGVTVGDKGEILLRRGYTQEELNVLGKDNVFYQGVGCPHRLANIQTGNVVLDLGCGFGLDSIIASHKVGAHGKVVAIDLSKGEIKRASENAAQRGIKNITFQVGDIETFEMPENEKADAIISNGAFCLVPDKPKAFTQMFKNLNPGGRISIAQSVQIKNLPDNIDWPLCMRVFYPLNQLKPLLESIGYTDIFIDMSDCLMSDPNDEKEEKEKTEEQKRLEEEKNKDRAFHFNDPKYEHLKNFDMNSLCARVVVYARKP